LTNVGILAPFEPQTTDMTAAKAATAIQWNDREVLGKFHRLFKFEPQRLCQQPLSKLSNHCTFPLERSSEPYTGCQTSKGME
jgi:hypothetical protein